MIQPKRLCWGLLLVATALWVCPRVAVAQTSTAKPAEEFPIQITATHLEAEHDKREITFRGQVVARYKDMILYADALKIFYEAQKELPPAADKSPAAAPESPLGGLGMDKLSRIEAQGHVRLVQEDKVASGEKATYYKAEDKVVLLGNPQLWRGESNLKGERITFYLTDNRAVVDGAPQKRVEATIFPGGKPRSGGKDTFPVPGSRER